jgi:penicillin amidase
LKQPVEVLRDRWGISHIYAKNENDLFFAQGYVVASDRLFQLELWRRQATGTLAEIQGPKALSRDVGSRLLRFRGDMKTELAAYHPRGGEIVSAFVNGINAYIARTEADPSLLPVEFRLLGIKPGAWTEAVVVSRHNGLFRNLTQEIQVARLVHAVGADRAHDLLNLHPGQPSLVADPKVDLGLIREPILELYKASRTAPRFLPEDVIPGERATPVAFAGSEENSPETEQWEGSNNWVVAGTRSASGSPLLANDPHRALQLPSLRYWVHLVAPGWDVTGAGEPALPGVSVGHNTRAAWGFTIFPIDQEDLYVYEIDPANPDRYRFGEGWEAMKVEREAIEVKGKGKVEAALKFTRHGPVLFEDRARHKAYALRATWLEPGSAPYLASLRVDQATTWAEFQEAAKFFATPSENLVWADRDGHVGWQAVGTSPIRKGWTGLLPIPGDGRFEWSGTLPPGELPHVLDPASGFFASANQDNLPADFPHAVGFQWADPYRFRRAEEALAESKKFSLADMTSLQQDVLALPARALVPLLRDLRPSGEPAKRARERLLAWDNVLSPDSVAAATYVAWERSLARLMVEQRVPEPVRDVVSPRSLSTERLVSWLLHPDARFGPDPAAGRDAVLLTALDQAVVDLGKRLGPDESRWRYGQDRFKHSYLFHPLAEALRPATRASLDIGPVARGGYAHTVNSTSPDDNQSAGATFRFVADLADWDQALGTNSPGQSGDPASPHYRDLFETWAAGEYFPVAYSRAKVEAVTEKRITLEP